MKVLVTGGRNYTNINAVRVQIEAITDMRAEPHILIHGAAAGADSLADTVARGLGWEIKSYPAPWYRPDGTINHSAGPMRNQQMLDENSDIELCIAFPGGGGTADMTRRARKAGIEVRRVR